MDFSRGEVVPLRSQDLIVQLSESELKARKEVQEWWGPTKERLSRISGQNAQHHATMCGDPGGTGVAGLQPLSRRMEPMTMTPLIAPPRPAHEGVHALASRRRPMLHHIHAPHLHLGLPLPPCLKHGWKSIDGGAESAACEPGLCCAAHVRRPG